MVLWFVCSTVLIATFDVYSLDIIRYAIQMTNKY